MDSQLAPCGSAAIFAPNGDADRARVYRCAREAGHSGGHTGGGFAWSDRYPEPEPSRIAAAEVGRLRDYDALAPLPKPKGTR